MDGHFFANVFRRVNGDVYDDKLHRRQTLTSEPNVGIYFLILTCEKFQFQKSGERIQHKRETVDLNLEYTCWITTLMTKNEFNDRVPS